MTADTFAILCTIAPFCNTSHWCYPSRAPKKTPSEKNYRNSKHFCKIKAQKASYKICQTKI